MKNLTITKEQFKNLINGSEDTIKAAIKKETGLEINSLSISQIGDLPENGEQPYYGKRTYLRSEYLDNLIGILGLSMKKVYLDISISFTKELYLAMSFDFRFNNLSGGSNGLSLKDNLGNGLDLFFEISDDNTLILKEDTILKENYKLIIYKHSDNQLDNKHLVGLRELGSYLEYHSENEENIKEIIVKEYINNEWIDYIPNEEEKEIVDNVIKNPKHYMY